MFDILSAARTDVSASIVVAFLSFDDGRNRRRPESPFWSRSAHGSFWFWRSARRARSARAGFGAPALGLDGRFAHRRARLDLSRPSLRAKCAGRDAPAGAHRPPRDPPARSDLCHSLRRGTPSGAVCAERGMGRYGHWRDRAAARLGCCAIRRPRAAARRLMERARGRRPRCGGQARRALGARSASGFRWTAGLFADDHFALAHHSGLSGPEPVFRSHRYLHSAVREDRGVGRAACVAGGASRRAPHPDSPVRESA